MILKLCARCNGHYYFLFGRGYTKVIHYEYLLYVLYCLLPYTTVQYSTVPTAYYSYLLPILLNSTYECYCTVPTTAMQYHAGLPEVLNGCRMAVRGLIYSIKRVQDHSLLAYLMPPFCLALLGYITRTVLCIVAI